MDASIIPGDGGEISELYKLRRWYGPLMDAGEYAVQATYRNYWDPDDGRVAWQGLITSDTVTFILEP